MKINDLDFRLDGQTALITGGGSGIGLAVSKAMIKSGASVVIMGRNEKKLQESCSRLGKNSHYIAYDVTHLHDIPKVISTIEDRWGPLSVLVNNAGIHLKKEALDTSNEEFAKMMQTHVYGSFAFSRECAASMGRRGHGSILMIVSMASLFGIPQVSAYSAAKSALLGLTRSLAVDFAPLGIRVNAIAPGWIETDISRKAMENDQGRFNKIIERTPLKRFGKPEEVSSAAVYLCSPAASFITGVVLPVDGGVSIGF